MINNGSLIRLPFFCVHRVGFEPTRISTGGLKPPPLDQLGHLCIMWIMRGLNSRPLAHKTNALPTELIIHAPLVGLEPTISRLEGERVIHCAIGVFTIIYIINISLNNNKLNKNLYINSIKIVNI